MKKIYGLFIALILIPAISAAQFDKPKLQVGIGYTLPKDGLQGDYIQGDILGSYYVLTVNDNFLTNNYGGKNGLYFFGKGKINFDKYSIVRGTFGLGYSAFNTFESAKSGNIGVEVLNINNELDTLLTSVKYDYNFSNFNIGIGLELAPTSFTGLLSPFFGGNLNFNFFNGELSRTENNFDSVKTSFGDFRMGVDFNGGIEARVSKELELVLGMKYDMGNLLFKNTSSAISDAIEYGKTGGSLNDEQGRFYSSIYGPVLSSVRREKISSEKKLNWGTIYIGVNIKLFSDEVPKKKKPATRPN